MFNKNLKLKLPKFSDFDIQKQTKLENHSIFGAKYTLYTPV